MSSKNIKDHFKPLKQSKYNIIIGQQEQMQVEQLTANGIERLFRGESAIVQIINTSFSPVSRLGQTIELITATINDGFAYYNSIYLFPDNFQNKKIESNVIRIKLSQGAIRKYTKGKVDAPLIIDTSVFAVVNNKIGKVIGKPIPYDEYVKNGKVNPNGCRKIMEPKEEEEETQDDLFAEAEKLKQKLKMNNKPVKIQESRDVSKVKKQQQNRGQSNTSRNSNSLSNTNINSNISRNTNTNQQSNTVQPQKQKPAQQASKPIVKLPQGNEKSQQRRLSIKPEVKHHQGIQKISQLFLGIQNFKILARLLFVWPIRLITNKKGNQSQLLNLQFGDSTGTILCTVFGENASRYSSLEVDQIYCITGAYVTEASYKGVTEIKLNFNDGTKVAIQKDYGQVPPIERFCKSLKQLAEIEKGRVATVICMVKQNEMVEFVSKNGNHIKKKLLKLYDLDNQVESDLTVFNEKAEVIYQPGMYALKGIQIDEFQGNKQYKSSLIFLPRYLHNHPLNKRTNETQEIIFEHLGGNSNQKSSNKNVISSFYTLNQKSQDIKLGESIWSEVVCYLKGVRLGGNSKCVYLGCPLCKKKILDQAATSCESCKKDIDRPIYRYILNVNLMDDHDNVWVNAYDEAGQALLTKPGQHAFTADTFASLSEQQLRQRVQEIRYRQVKAKIVSNKQSFNNQTKLKHKIVKLLPINYAEEAKGLLQKIRSI